MEFDEGAALSLCDRNGNVTRENFFEFAVKTNLVDWSTISDKVEKRPQDTPRKVGVSMNPRAVRPVPRRSKTICCFGSRQTSPEDVDRIEHAFKKMDINNTGFVTWKQFKKAGLIHNINI